MLFKVKPLGKDKSEEGVFKVAKIVAFAPDSPVNSVPQGTANDKTAKPDKTFVQSVTFTTSVPRTSSQRAD